MTNPIPIPLIRECLALSAGPVPPPNGLYTLCCSELDWVSLPKYWNVIEKKPMPLSNVLWIATRDLRILKKLPYHATRREDGLQGLMDEWLGYLEIRLGKRNIYVCRVIYKTEKL